MFAMLKQHVPRIAELKPGVVTVKFLDGKEDTYFISGGFAFMQKVNISLDFIFILFYFLG